MKLKQKILIKKKLFILVSKIFSETPFINAITVLSTIFLLATRHLRRKTVLSLRVSFVAFNSFLKRAQFLWIVQSSAQLCEFAYFGTNVR